jgi:hypothetical protein
MLRFATLLGNQWRRKFFTTALPASRPEEGFQGQTSCFQKLTFVSAFIVISPV